MTKRMVHNVVLSACVLILSASAFAQVPTFTYQAIARNGAALPGGPVSHLQVLPGDVITVEVWLRDYSPGDVGLRGYQLAFDPDGYTSGTSGNVLPRDFYLHTTVGDDNAENLFVDKTHPMYIFRECDSVTGDFSTTINYWLLGANGDPQCVVLATPGVPAYTGTIILEASVDAHGTFTIRHDEHDVLVSLPGPDNQFLVNVDDDYIWPYEVEPLTIEVVDYIPECGNGTIDPGEMCDDGNNDALDGCSPGCKIEAPVPAPVVSTFGMAAIMLTLGAGVARAGRRKTA